MLKASRLLSGRGAGTRTQAWLTGALLLTILLTMTPGAVAGLRLALNGSVLGVTHLRSHCLLCRSVQFSPVAQLCLTLCDPMDCSTSGLPVHHQLSEFTQAQILGVGDAIQPSHPLLSPSPPTFNLAQHQGLFQGVSSLNQVTKVLEFQLQHQTFQ